MFDIIKNENSFTSIATINAELTGKLFKRFHLCPVLWLLGKSLFNTNIARTMQANVISLNEKKNKKQRAKLGRVLC